jgi:hypothetical protein
VEIFFAQSKVCAIIDKKNRRNEMKVWEEKKVLILMNFPLLSIQDR